MNRGGAESMLMSIYRNLDRTQVQFDFLEFADGQSAFTSEIQLLGGRVLKCKWSQRPYRLLETRRALTELIKKAGPYTAVHCHTLFASGTILAAAQDAGVDVRIAHAHSTSDIGGGVLRKCYRRLARWVIRRKSTAYVACSTEAGRFLFGSGFSDMEGVIVPNSVDLELFHPTAHVENQKQTSSKRTILVAIARLEPVKNHNFLIELASELRSRNFNFFLKFVGTGSLHSDLDAAISEKGLGDWIELSGVRTDVEKILQGSDVMLMPSLWEGLPVSLVEAQATGVHCLVSNSITREADLGLGLLNYLPLNDVSAWADIVENGFPPSPSRAQIRDAFQARGYTLESSVERLLSLYGIKTDGAG